MYADYSNKYSENMKVFAKLELKNPKFKAAVDECHLVCLIDDIPDFFGLFKEKEISNKFT